MKYTVYYVYNVFITGLHVILPSRNEFISLINQSAVGQIFDLDHAKMYPTACGNADQSLLYVRVQTMNS